MNAEAVNNITLGGIVAIVVAVGVLSGFFGKLFAQIYKIKQLGEKVEELEKKMTDFETLQKQQKSELIDKVEETNNAVNLICSAVSALIDDSLQDNQESKQRLRDIKNKLDNKKEIV
jgi:tRNA(Ile)-lysidine synthase TilS/MesJ